MKHIKKLYLAIYILAIILFLFMFYRHAFNERQRLIDKYNQGVQYYESGNYVEAMEIFRDLKGWGNCVDISPEDYFNMASARLVGSENEKTTICPECGAIITRIKEGG